MIFCIPASDARIDRFIASRWYRDTMRLTDADYEDLLALRTGLRRFLRWSEQQAETAGLTPSQHQLLLAIRGHTDERGPTTSSFATTVQWDWSTGPRRPVWSRGLATRRTTESSGSNSRRRGRRSS